MMVMSTARCVYDDQVVSGFGLLGQEVESLIRYWEIGLAEEERTWARIILCSRCGHILSEISLSGLIKETRLGWRGKQGRGCLCSNDDQVVSGFGLGLKQELCA